MPSETADLQVIIHRIEALESENKRLRRAGVAAAALAVVLLGMAQAKPKRSVEAQESIRNYRFDADGEARLTDWMCEHLEAAASRSERLREGKRTESARLETNGCILSDVETPSEFRSSALWAAAITDSTGTRTGGSDQEPLRQPRAVGVYGVGRENSGDCVVSAPARPIPSSSPPLLIEALVKRFGHVTAVDGITLELQSGECLGLLGPNGAGKSTLIRSIVGRVVPDAGSAAVFGSPANSAASRAALGWVPQELALYPRLTCKENLESFGRYHGLAGTGLRQAVAWCLDWSSLQDRAGELAQNLSGGMRRRLNMAAGMIHRPNLVLMDEPTVGVDPQSRNRIFEMIEELHGKGTAIIYTTHYMEEAERLCDRVAIVDHGRIIALGTNEELVQNAFASRSQVLARFAGLTDGVATWVAQRGGRLVDSTAQFTVEHPTEIAGLLDDAAKADLELIDVSLRRPNLESVFLHLTGRELRE